MHACNWVRVTISYLRGYSIETRRTQDDEALVAVLRQMAESGEPLGRVPAQQLHEDTERWLDAAIKANVLNEHVGDGTVSAASAPVWTALRREFGEPKEERTRAGNRAAMAAGVQ